MDFFSQYFQIMTDAVGQFDSKLLQQAKNLILQKKAEGKKVIIVGNGGSAAMASHVSVDLTKVGGVRAINFNEADLLTCFANDFGYENWVTKALEYYSDPGDLVILISSSGKSPNMTKAAEAAKKMKLALITFSGFSPDNPLRKLGDINFWVDSKGYNIVEMTHHIWLLALVDAIVGKTEYAAN